MPLPGGPADKLGNRYELWWTISRLVRILDGQAASIRIEEPTADKAEFVITAGNQKELHQAKRSHPNGKWSLSSLRDEGLLQAIFDQLYKDSNARFVFVSGSDAPELKELAARAVNAKNLEEFESAFVGADVHKKALEKLNNSWHDTDIATAYEILQRIEVRTIDERGLEEQVRGALQVRFLTNPNDVRDALLSIVENSIHRAIDCESLVSILESRGFRRRKLSRPNDAPPLISEATDSYLKFARRKLIQDPLIPRPSTPKLLAEIKKNTAKGAAYVLTGKAGGGKTGCVIESVEALRQGNSPVVVLAFRLNPRDSIASTKELGEQLGLEESPVLVLATAAETMSSEAVLVIDQFDAVGTTSGRSSDLFDVVEDLLVEAQNLPSKVKFHVVVVCRKFDWENDHRLRRSLPKGAVNIDVTDFSLDEVKTVLTRSGFDTELFGAKQLELLRLPQNLALFLEADYDPHSRPLFSSPKELFDQYWEEKRRKVNDRTTPLPDHWNGVIQLLCDEMTASRQLSARKEKLDQFPKDYLAQMASEGVLSFDGEHYSFGHESFFDYCFARGFVAKEESLTAFLVNSEQHLFRRAQVRQVLEYLRGTDRDWYCRELSGLLTDERIRVHLKDLAVALAVSIPNPEENEWEVLAPWIKSQLEALSSGEPNPDKFTSLVWDKVLFSQQWFQIVDQKGLVAAWLSSENDALANIGVSYVSSHQRYSGDRVAELLEPFVGKDGDWPQRLCNVMQWADYANSRRFFTLFLKLIENGTLDDLRSPATNGTFWLMLDNLEEKRPEWIPEVLAHWLLRRFSIVQKIIDSGGKSDWRSWRNSFSHDGFGSEPICNSATKSPDKFVQYVLPVVLKITEETLYEGQAPPKRDAVWSYLFNREHPSVDESCREALAGALGKLAERKAESITDIFAELRNRETHMANYLLLRAYTAGARYFADDAVSELCDKTWRFECGYADSTHWTAIQLIEAIAPLCSDENRAKLENTILDYVPHYERTPDGYKSRGHTCFALLSSIPVELRSKEAQARYAEFERKFGVTESPPRGIQSYRVESPIKKTAAEKMTAEQWLRAIKKYNSEDKRNWETPEKGGALELARTLQESVKGEPERFARLSLRFPSDTNPVYLEHSLMGLKETGGFTELKLQVCRKAYSEARKDCGQAIADLLGSIEEALPEDAVEMLDWLATEHPEPEKELWREKAPSGGVYYGGDILTHGINTTRGRAAWAICSLIGRAASYVERFRPTVERVVHDKSAAVRACASSALLAIVNHDSESALEHFLRLVEPRGNQIDDDRLLATRDVERFINYGLYEYFGRLGHVVERMLRSGQPETSEAGARLASIAVLLHHNDAEALVEESLHGNSSQRLGVVQVASANIDKTEHREWSEQQLLLLFNDSDRGVRQEAASCFRRIEGQPLESYENLINEFCNSAAYQEDSFPLLHALEESPQKLPGITHTVCEKFLERFSDEARDMRTHRALDSRNLAKLILRTYHQHQHDDWASRCLDLIDRMCLEGTYEIRTNLDEYER